MSHLLYQHCETESQLVFNEICQKEKIYFQATRRIPKILKYCSTVHLVAGNTLS